MKTQRWQDWVMLILGVWVFLAPFWMPAYTARSDAAAWSSYILGILVVAFAWAALATRDLWEERVNIALGVLLVISPFVLGFYRTEGGAAWNQIILGILIGADAIWMLAAYRATERAGA